jgi:NTE family protein
MATLNIMEEEICRARLAGNPPAVELKPRVGHIESLEFHRAEEAVQAGVDCTQKMLPAIQDAIESWKEYAR